MGLHLAFFVFSMTVIGALVCKSGSGIFGGSRAGILFHFNFIKIQKLPKP